MKNDSLALVNEIVIACFFGTWIVLGIGGTVVFFVRKDVAFKRKWWPWYVILAGGLFVLFATAIAVLETRSLKALALLIVMVPFVALTSYLNLRFIKFCDGCGATAYDMNWFAPMRFCPKCGTEFGAKPVVPGDHLE